MGSKSVPGSDIGAVQSLHAPIGPRPTSRVVGGPSIAAVADHGSEPVSGFGRIEMAEKGDFRNHMSPDERKSHERYQAERFARQRQIRTVADWIAANRPADDPLIADDIANRILRAAENDNNAEARRPAADLAENTAQHRAWRAAIDFDALFLALFALTLTLAGATGLVLLQGY